MPNAWPQLTLLLWWPRQQGSCLFFCFPLHSYLFLQNICCLFKCSTYSCDQMGSLNIIWGKCEHNIKKLFIYTQYTHHSERNPTTPKRLVALETKWLPTWLNNYLTCIYNIYYNSVAAGIFFKACSVSGVWWHKYARLKLFQGVLGNYKIARRDNYVNKIDKNPQAAVL